MDIKQHNYTYFWKHIYRKGIHWRHLPILKVPTPQDPVLVIYFFGVCPIIKKKNNSGTVFMGAPNKHDAYR